MIKRYTIILILTCIPLNSFAQTDLSKKEIYDLWVKHIKPVPDSVRLKYELDSIVLCFIDSMKISGIDTLGVYSEMYPGFYFDDSCMQGIVPWNTFVHWSDKGRIYHREFSENCVFSKKRIDYSVLLSYYLAAKNRINKERILPPITGAIDDGGEPSIIFSMIDHTTHYLIYVKYGDLTKLIKYEEFFLEEKEGLFYDDNNNSTIESWGKMIENDIYDIKGIEPPVHNSQYK